MVIAVQNEVHAMSVACWSHS